MRSVVHVIQIKETGRQSTVSNRFAWRSRGRRRSFDLRAIGRTGFQVRISGESRFTDHADVRIIHILPVARAHYIGTLHLNKESVISGALFRTIRRFGSGLGDDEIVGIKNLRVQVIPVWFGTVRIHPTIDSGRTRSDVRCIRILRKKETRIRNFLAVTKTFVSRTKRFDHEPKINDKNSARVSAVRGRRDSSHVFFGSKKSVGDRKVAIRGNIRG